MASAIPKAKRSCHTFSLKGCAHAGADGSWRDWTILQFSDYFRIRLMAERAGLWLDADVLLLKPVEIDPTKPYFAWSVAPARKLRSLSAAGRAIRRRVPRP